jgi:hypothetical protein
MLLDFPFSLSLLVPPFPLFGSYGFGAIISPRLFLSNKKGETLEEF